MSKSNIIKFHKAAPQADNVFFTKEQIEVGTELVYLGRHDPGVVWKVKEIRTFKITNGQLRSHKTNKVEKLDDEVQMVCVGQTKGRYLELTFSYLSYSAIWQIKSKE